MTAVRTFVVDRLHGRVRVGVLFAWLGSWALLLGLGFIVAALIFNSQPLLFWLPWALATLWGSQFPARWAEDRLADLWPSSRRVTLDPAKLTLADGAEAVTIRRAEPAAVQTWAFKIKRQRGARVPSGHFCLSARWTQGAAEVVLYAFASPTESAELRANHGFYELLSSRDRPGATDVGNRGRLETYLAAEAARYERGGELSFADFAALVEAMATAPTA